jgi:hypothetical protein
MKNSAHGGQVALVLVLIMTVVSALAVSLATRSTVDTRIQRTESESVNALIFAQTGLERLMMNPTDFSVTDKNFEGERLDLGSESLDLGLVSAGSTIELNLIGADFSKLNAFRVYWGPGEGSEADKPAIFISIIDGNGTIFDYAYDYDGLNGFMLASDASGVYQKVSSDILINANTFSVRITVLGSPALLSIVPVGAGSSFPPQIVSLRSVGTVDSDDKQVKYGLRYDESAVNNIPGVFDYALFSGGSIVQ